MNIYNSFCAMLLFCCILLSPSLMYADSQDFDCNDLYGDCNQFDNSKSHADSTYDPGVIINKKSNVSQYNAPNRLQQENKHTTKQSQGTAFVSSGAMPQLGRYKKNFLYSVVFLTALFDNGVQKQGYGILLKDGYTLAAADLMTEEGAYLRSVMAKMQDDSTNSLMCFAMLRLRATDNKLSLLRAENYTDIYCNTRPESFYHQRINLHYFTPIRTGMLKSTVLSRSDNVLFPFIAENNTLHYKSSSLVNVQKHSAIYGLPLFNGSGNFVGFLYTTNNPKQRNVVISSDEVRNFICTIAQKRLLPTSDLTRSCLGK